MAYTLNRRLAQLVDSNGQLNTGKIPNDYISSDHIADNVITASMLHTSFTVSTSNLTAIDTDDVSEGSSNLYYTNARADARIALQVGANLDLSSKDTDDLSEGSTNLYFTNARVDSRLSGGTGVTYSSGEISIGQDVGTSATPTFGNITTTGYIAGPATFTIDPAAVGDNTGTVVIAGNLQVDGTTTTINSTTLSVDDLNITLASGAANAAAADGAGITVDGASATITYDGTNDEWDFNKSVRISSAGTVTLKASPLGSTYGSGFNVMTVTGTSSSPYTSTIAFNNYGVTDAMVIEGGNVGIAKSSLTTWSSGYNALQIGGKGFVGAHSSSDLYVGQNASFNSGWKYETSVAASLTQHSGGKITQFVAPAGTAGNAISWNRAIDINPTGEVAIGLTAANGIALKIGNSANNSAITRVTNGTVLVDLTASSSGKAFLEVGTSHPLVLATNATERMVIEAGGDVSVKAGNEFRLYRSDNATYGSLEYMSGAGGLKLRDVNGDGMTFAGHSGNDYINIVGSNGNVGINHGLGGGGMNSKFNVFADGEALRVDGTSNTSRTIRFRNTGVNGSANAIITSDGSLQLKNEDANAAIYINSVRDMEFQVTSGNGTAGHMRWYSYNTQVMHLDGANNRIGIGTDSPNELLHTSRSSNGSGLLLENTTGGTGAYITLDFSTYNVDQANFANAAASIRVIDDGAYSGDITFRTKGASINAAQTERMRIDGATGNVGINDTDPHGTLTVTGPRILVQRTNDDSSIAFANNATGAPSSHVWAAGLNYSNSNAFTIAYQANAVPSLESHKMVVTTAGNVGIGTDSPFSKLSINSNGAPATSTGDMASTGLTVHNGTGGTAVQLGTYDAGSWGYIQSGYVNNATVAREFRIMNGANYTMTLSNTGKVGIGTETPFAKSHIVDTGWSSGAPYGTVQLIEGKFVNDNNWGHLVITDEETGSGQGGSLRFATGSSNALNPFAGIQGVAEGTSYGGLGFYTRPNGGTATERMRIDSSGQVVIQDDVSYTANAPTHRGSLILAGASGFTNYGGLEFHTSSGGGAGYGTRIVSSDASMFFGRRFNATGWSESMRINNDGWVGIGGINPTSLLDVNGVISIKTNDVIDSDGTSHYFKTPAGGAMYFYHGTSGIMYVSSAGLLPVSDNARDLGSTSNRWRNLYTTDLHLSNEGKPEGNEVDGTTGNWTIQEGEEHLYIINNKSGKKYRFALEEIE